MKKLITLLAAAALTAVCMTPAPLYAADEQTEKTTDKTAAAAAEINGNAYPSLSDAIQAVSEGQTIKLLSDMNLTATIDVTNKAFSLDLNGKNITQQLNESVGKTTAPIRLFNSSLIINDSVGNGSIFGYQCAVGVFVNSSLTLNSGALTGEWYGLAGNGFQNNGTNIVINGGSITNADPDGTGAAIYHPQTGEITINGGEIKGDLGIQLCAGNLSVMNINGGRIEGTGLDHRVDKTGDGAVPDGAAISIVNRTGYSSVPRVAISGGTFKSANSEGLLAYTWDKNTALEWKEANDHVQVTGGTFDSDPTAYVKDTHKAFVSGSDYIVAPLATKITLSEKDILLEENTSRTLTASLAPEGTLETAVWTSSDSSIAAVENGRVTALKAGTAVITAETESGKTASCTVTVTKPVTIETPSINTSKPTDEIKVGINDDKADQILKNVTAQIIAGVKDYTDADTVKAVAKAIEDGKALSVVTIINEADTSFSAVKADAEKIQKKLETLTADNQNTATVAMYLDLHMQIRDGSTVLGNITKLSEPVTFTVMLPKSLQAEGRSYYVLRVHDGGVDNIAAAVNGDVLTFETDRFSTYAIVYEDKRVADNGTEIPDPKPETPDSKPTTPEKNVYNVVFVDMNGAVLRTEKVEANNSATAPKAPKVDGYRFIKWDTDYTNVTKDLLVKAVYEKTSAAKKPAASEKPSGENRSPDTGDSTNAELFAAFALLGIVSMGILAVQRKRKQLMK